MQRLARQPSRPATTPRWPSVCVAFGSGHLSLPAAFVPATWTPPAMTRSGHRPACGSDTAPYRDALGDAGREQRPVLLRDVPVRRRGLELDRTAPSHARAVRCSSVGPRPCSRGHQSHTHTATARRDGSARHWAICGGRVCAAAAILPPVDVQAVQRRIAPGKYDVQDSVELCEGRRPTDQMAERVRHWLHLPPKWQWTTNLVCHALPATAARRLSPFVAGGVVPCGTALSLQPLENKAQSKNSAGWHRFCLLLELRPDAMGKSVEVSLDAWRHADLQ